MTHHSLLQTDTWGAFRESLGWRAHKVGDILVLERALPFGRTFLYSPEVATEPEKLTELLPEVYSIAKRRRAVFYRLELLDETNAPIAERWRAAFAYTGFTQAFESVQPEHRQVIPLRGGEAAVLAQMRPKGRYNIHVAEKAGVVVREATAKTLAQDLETFCRLTQDTARRERFAARPSSYFSRLSHVLYAHDCGRLFLAEYQGETLAVAITTLADDVVSYLYGASSQANRSVMAPYALHWAIILWAISRHARFYDLLAISPPGRRHRFDGITRFKQQFGGRDVHLLGNWDLVINPMWYHLCQAGERLRRKGAR